MSALAVEAEGLVKTFGSTRALDGIDLQIPQGTVLGLLGPNGTDKTTAVRILSTLLRTGCGVGPGGGCRRAHGSARGARQDRAVRAVRGSRCEPHRVRESVRDQPAVRDAPALGPGPDHPISPRRGRRADREDLLRRHAQAA